MDQTETREKETHKGSSLSGHNTHTLVYINMFMYMFLCDCRAKVGSSNVQLAEFSVHIFPLRFSNEPKMQLLH